MVDLFFRSFDELYTGDIFFFFLPLSVSMAGGSFLGAILVTLGVC